MNYAMAVVGQAETVIDAAELVKIESCHLPGMYNVGHSQFDGSAALNGTFMQANIIKITIKPNPLPRLDLGWQAYE